MVNKDIAVFLAKNMASISYEDIPAEAVQATKYFILDTLGVTVAGGTLGDGPREVVELVKEWGGKPESTIIGFGGKVPCLMAAFANGAMAHALDYDDCLDTGFVHPGVTTVPSALAISERLGGISGKELITAVALGYDVICRLAHSIAQGPSKWSPRWMPTAIFGVFSSSATCAKLLNLDEGGIVSAFGIALNQAAGTFEMAFSPTANVRAIYAGFPAEAGLKAALLAERGITAPETSLEGTAGLYNMYFSAGYDPAVALDRLGERFEITEVSFKPWPSCRASHTYIEATLELVREYDIQPEDIKRVVVHVGDFSQTLCQPLEERQRPSTSTTAKFSVPFAVAVTIVHRKVMLHHFSGEGIKDERVLQLAQRVIPRYDQRFNKSTGEPPALVKIETNDGKVYAKEVQEPYGSPQKPMTTEELIAKFNDCLSYAPKPSVKNNSRKVIAMVNALEEVDDMARVMELLG